MLIRNNERPKDPEGFICHDYEWWSTTKLQFVLNHLEPWWNVAPADSACPGPFSCEAHYDLVQFYVWRIGGVLHCYEYLPPQVRKDIFAAFDESYHEFHKAWFDSAGSPSERRLPDAMIEEWWKLFGNNELRTHS